MTNFLKARQTTTLAAVALAFGLALLAVGEHPLAIPAFNPAGSGELFTKLLLPLIPATAVVWSLSAARSVEERTAARPVHGYCVVYLMCAAAVYCLVALGMQAIGGGHDPMSLVRNVLGYIGLATVMATFLQPVHAAAATVLLALFSLTFGRVNGVYTPAAWPVVPSHHWESWAIACGLFVAGAVLFLLDRPVNR